MNVTRLLLTGAFAVLATGALSVGCGADEGAPQPGPLNENTDKTNGQLVGKVPESGACPTPTTGPGNTCEQYLGHAPVAGSADCVTMVKSYTAYGNGDNIQLRSQNPTFCRNAPNAAQDGCDEFGALTFCSKGKKCKQARPGQPHGCSSTTGLGWCPDSIDGLAAFRCDASAEGIRRGLNLCPSSAGGAWKTYKKTRGYVQGQFNPGTATGTDPIEGVGNRDLIAGRFKNPCGLVEYRAEVDLLLPRDPAKSNNTLVFEPVNRGYKFGHLHYNNLSGVLKDGDNAPGYLDGHDNHVRASSHYQNPLFASDAGHPKNGHALLNDGYVMAFAANVGDLFTPSPVKASGATCQIPYAPIPQGTCSNGELCFMPPGAPVGNCVAPVARDRDNVMFNQQTGQYEQLLSNRLRVWTRNFVDYPALENAGDPKSGGWQDPNGLRTTNAATPIPGTACPAGYNGFGQDCTAPATCNTTLHMCTTSTGDGAANGFPWAADSVNGVNGMTGMVSEIMVQDASRGGGSLQVAAGTTIESCTSDAGCTSADRPKCYTMNGPPGTLGVCVAGCGTNEPIACGGSPGLTCDCSSGAGGAAVKCKTIDEPKGSPATIYPTVPAGGDCRIPPTLCSSGICDFNTGKCKASTPKSDQGVCKCAPTATLEIVTEAGTTVARCVNRTASLGQAFANPPLPANGFAGGRPILNGATANGSGAKMYWYKPDLFDNGPPSLCGAVQDSCLTELGGPHGEPGSSNTKYGRCGQIKWKTNCGTSDGSCTAANVPDPENPSVMQSTLDDGVSWVNPVGLMRIGKAESSSGGSATLTGSGFLTDRAYVVCYNAQKPTVKGLTNVLIRDTAIFMQKSASSPLATYRVGSGASAHMYTVGIGLIKSGGVLKDLVYRGYNEGLDPRDLTKTTTAFDGIMPWAVGANRANSNTPFDQSTRGPFDVENATSPTNGRNIISKNWITSPPPNEAEDNSTNATNITQSEFPMTYQTLSPPMGFAARTCNNSTNPCPVGACSVASGNGTCQDGILRLCTLRGTCPKVSEEATDNDFHQHQASWLSMYVDRADGVTKDVPNLAFQGSTASGVRLYYHGSTQADPMSIGTTGDPSTTFNKNPGREVQNALSYQSGKLMLLQSMRRWIIKGKNENYSAYPRVSTSVDETTFHNRPVWKTGNTGVWTRSGSDDAVCTTQEAAKCNNQCVGGANNGKGCTLGGTDCPSGTCTSLGIIGASVVPGRACTKVAGVATCRQTAVNLDVNGKQMPCGTGWANATGTLRSPCPYAAGFWENTRGNVGTYDNGVAEYNQPGYVGWANPFRMWKRVNMITPTPYAIDGTTHLAIPVRLPDIDQYGNACNENSSRTSSCVNGPAGISSIDIAVPTSIYSGRGLRTDGNMGGLLRTSGGVNCTAGSCAPQVTTPGRMDFLQGSRRSWPLCEGDRYSSGQPGVGTLKSTLPAFCTVYGCAARYKQIRRCYAHSEFSLAQCKTKAAQSSSQWYASCTAAPECQCAQ